MKVKLYGMVLGLLLLIGCGGQGDVVETAVPPQPTATEVVEEVEVIEEATAELAAAATPEPEATDGLRRFVIVPEMSEASYQVEEEFFQQAVERLGVDLGETITVGSTQEVEGEFVLDLTQTFPLVENQFTVNIRSLTSDQFRRDERIREESLESDKFPLATFVATAVEGFPATYTEGEEITFQLIGDLTIREIAQPTTFAVTAVLDNNTISGTATATILMTDFGFDPPSIGNFFTVANEVLITLDFLAEEGG